MSGYIRLFRDIRNHWIWEDANKLKWWIDIIMLANYKPNKILMGNSLQEVKRGQFHTSELKLATRWGVNRKTVSNFLNLLEEDEMIVTKRTALGTTIEVLNYKEYQDISSEFGTTQRTTDGTEDGTEERTEDGTLPIKDKESKKKKKDILSFSKEIKEIIDYLNSVCGTNYRHTTAKNQSLINARLNEKFTVDDFKKVINVKYQEWGKDEKMKKYLRPETLFGTKFEGYLNQAPNTNAVNDNEKDPDPF